MHIDSLLSRPQAENRKSTTIMKRVPVIPSCPTLALLALGLSALLFHNLEGRELTDRNQAWAIQALAENNPSDNPYIGMKKEELDLTKELFQEALKGDSKDEAIRTELELVKEALKRLEDTKQDKEAPALDKKGEDKGPATSEDTRAGREVDSIMKKLDNAKKSLESAKKLIESGRSLEAERLLAIAQRDLPDTLLTKSVRDETIQLRSTILMDRAREALMKGNFGTVDFEIDNYIQKFGKNEIIKAFEEEYSLALRDPESYKPFNISPKYARQKEIVSRLFAKARAQYTYGDLEGARITLREIESRDPENTEAKILVEEIERGSTKNNSRANRLKTAAEMFRSVANAWQRPRAFTSRAEEKDEREVSAVRERLSKIIIPDFTVGDPRRNGQKVTLSEAVLHLQVLIKQYDPAIKLGVGKPINIIEPIEKEGTAEEFAFKMEGASVDDILDRMLQRLKGYTWTVDQKGNVLIEEGEIDSLTRIEFFNVEGLIQRLGLLQKTLSGDSGSNDPFEDSGGNNSSNDAVSGSATSITKSIKDFLASAGVSFAAKEATLAYDGSGKIIVKHRPRELDQIRNILRRYDETQQVEIEAKFLEVRGTDLSETGFSWVASKVGNNFFKFNTQNRNLGTLFSSSQEAQTLTVRRTPAEGEEPLEPISLPQVPPAGPFAPDTGQGVGSLIALRGIFSHLNLDLAIRALERDQEVDLLTAPRVTVIGGHEANILIAQDFVYPSGYSSLQANVSESGDSIAITGGAPAGFQTEEIGIKLAVTPEVQDDRISIELRPEIVQFEGFITYGSSSVAINSNTQITLPPVFHRPIFSRRRVETKVTVFDGATVVIGGLTREEVKKVNDRVPLLGDLPLIGKLFRNEGEASEKRNLLIFVTANLISPGGAPRKERLSSGKDSLFQNPIIVTPGGPVIRKIRVDE